MKKINSRAKGAGAERKLVKLFADWWGSPFFRTPGSGAFATRGFTPDMMTLAGDLVTPDPTFPFCVESKKVEGWHLEQLLTSDKTKIHKWWEQTLNETPGGKIPLLVFTRNRAPLFVMMSGDAFYDIMDLIPPFFEYRLAHEVVCIFELKYLFETNKEIWYDR